MRLEVGLQSLLKDLLTALLSPELRGLRNPAWKP